MARSSATKRWFLFATTVLALSTALLHSSSVWWVDVVVTIDPLVEASWAGANQAAVAAPAEAGEAVRPHDAAAADDPAKADDVDAARSDEDAELAAGKAAAPDEIADGGKTAHPFLLVFSTQRSGSTSFMGFLNKLLGYKMGWEVLNRNQYPEWVEGVVNMSSTDAHEHLCEFRKRFVQSFCQSRVCGFKIFPNHLPRNDIHGILQCPGDVRIVVLERKDRQAMYRSYSLAMDTGWWGPSKDKPANWVDKPENHHKQSFEEWNEQISDWFRAVYSLPESLTVYSEDLNKDVNATMRRVNDWVWSKSLG